MKINNLPEYAKNCRYIVVRLNGDDAWFWGAYEDLPKAYQSANEINGIVVEKEPFMNKPCVSVGVCEHDKMKVLDKVREDIADTLYVDSLIFGELIDFKDGKISADDVIEEFNRVTRLEVLRIIDKYKAESEGEND